MPRKSGTGRRAFLKSVAAAGGAAAAQAQPPRPARAAAAKAKTQRAGIDFPRVFTGPQLAMLAFPLGGVGAGSISLGGRGQLRDWEIFNRPDKGRSPQYAFASLWAQRGGAAAFASVLESRMLPPYEGASGLGSNNVPGLPRLESATFRGSYPTASIAFADSRCPVHVTLEAFSPVIPLEADDSGLPLAILRYRVKNPGPATQVAIAFSIENPVRTERSGFGDGRVNDVRRGNGAAGVFMHNPLLGASDPMKGSFALALLDAGAETNVTFLRGWRGGTVWKAGALAFWDDFASDGTLGSEAAVRDPIGSIALKREIPQGGEATWTFLLAWHFPNRTPDRCGWSSPKGQEHAIIGNHYATRFKDAWAVIEHAVPRLDGLETKTRQFVSAISDSSLPPEVREGAMANLSTLATPTSFRTADGVFRGFEGSNNQRGCCFGSCTHVWNYEHALAHVFPSLSRSMREAAFLASTDAKGLQSFREFLPHGEQVFGLAAADGQMGQLIKLYLDYKLSGDLDWLRKLWPAARRTLEFAWIPNGWDADRDGVMEGVQHNTYDVEFFGPNPLCGVWYLGALRACEEMARAVDDGGFAAECRKLFDRGSRWIDANLFNGEYYIQQVRGVPRDRIAEGLIVGMGSVDTETPEFQLGDGCLVDQLVGQYSAYVAGLGLLLDRGKVAKALDSIYRYNYKRSLYQHESVQRIYALNDEAAVVIADYGKGKRPRVPFPYFAEVMTGFEYAAAILMLFHGQTARGLELIGNIRRRYDGVRRNPWNEAECGHHYARAMASWAAIPALSGFEYDAPARRLSIKPRLAGDMRSFWSTGTGWGSFQLAGGKLRLQVSHGELPVREVVLPGGVETMSHVFHAAPGRELRIG